MSHATTDSNDLPPAVAAATAAMPLAPLTPGNAPLEGLRVLDFTRVLSGPLATMLLADLGAEVIRVEDIEGSDITRHNHPFVGGESHYYLSLNRNKRGISVDLKSQEGRALMRDLALKSDVLIENFRPGVIDRLGLGARDLHPHNPRLIIANLSAFGQDGPWRDKTAYDLVIQALTGAMAVTGEPGRPPVKTGLPLADEMTGLFAVIGILAALEKRDREGVGSVLDVGMYDVGVSLLSYIANIFFATGKSAPPQGSAHPTIYPYNAFKVKDGHIVAAPFTQAFWRNFCGVIGRPDLPAEERFRNFAARIQNRAELAAILDPIMASRTSAEWRAALDTGDVPNGPINSVGAALDMEQTRHRGMVVALEHPAAGRFRTLGTVFHYSWSDGTRFEPGFTAAPVLGQHTRQILAGRLGLDDTRIDALVAGKAINVATIAPATPLPNATPTLRAGEMPAARGAASMPLAGVRVLDLTRMLAGPLGGLILADLGADVVKVEDPDGGDPTRFNIPYVGKESSYFMGLNRGKRGIAIDLKSAAGKAALLEMVAKADILLENFRPGIMDKLGLGYAVLSKVNPRLIYLAVSGFGQAGPMRDKISFDLVNQAMAGTMAITGEEGREPVRIGLPAGDLNGGIFGACSVLAALYRRRRSGVGCYVDIALHDLLVSLLGYMGQAYLLTGESPQPVGSGHHNVLPYRCYEASDGYFVIAALSHDFWVKFAKAIDRGELVEDARFKTMTDRKHHRAELDAIVEPIFRTRTVKEWLAHLEACDVPCAPVASVGEALLSEHAQAREIVFEVEHATVGRQRSIGTPLRAGTQHWRTVRAAPVLGQHQTEVLREWLGYDDARVAALGEWRK